MDTVEIVVTSPVTNEDKPADLVICSKCQSDTFYLYYIVPDKTPHLQCTNCDTVYCQGNCCH